MSGECLAIDFLTLETADALMIVSAAWVVFALAWGGRQVIRFLGGR